MKVVIQFHKEILSDLPADLSQETFAQEINAAIRREIDRAEAAGTTPDFISGYSSGDQAFSGFIESLQADDHLFEDM